MNTVQIEQQRNLLHAIVLDISDVEQIAFGSSHDLNSKQRLLSEKLCQIRQNAVAGMNNQEIINRIIQGYHDDCMTQLAWMWETFEDLIYNDVVGDEQMQQLALAARNFSNLAEKYLQVKNGAGKEVDNG